jgi:hypothetical protein
MFWPIKRKKGLRRRPSKMRRRRERHLAVESLESREVLSGIVGVAVSGGILSLVGDQPLTAGGMEQPSDNSVLVEQGAAVGQLIITGQDNTLLREGGSLKQSTTVNGVISINVSLGLMNDTFELKGIDPAGAGTLPADPSGTPALIRGSITIVNDECGVKKNTIDNAIIKDDVFIEKVAGVYNRGEVWIYDTTIEGSLMVDNANGGGGGSTSTTLHRVHLERQLTILNGFDLDFVDIQDCEIDKSTAAGTNINNGPGGSRTTFTSTGATGNVLYGALTITNGANPIDVPGLPLLDDLVTFNRTIVLGAVTINNDGGDSRVAILDQSQLGTNINVAGQVTVLNAAGVDMFDMDESAAPFGIYIDNATSDTIAVPDMYGSTTTITRSELGCCLLQSGQHALFVLGDAAKDVVEITECKPPDIGDISPTIIGPVELKLFDGNNEVLIEENDPIQGLLIETGRHMDRVIIRGTDAEKQVIMIPSITMGDSNDLLVLEHVEVLGDALLDGDLVSNMAFQDELQRSVDVVFAGGVLNQINWEIIN